MAINPSTIAQALATDYSPFVIEKASLSNAAAGQIFSLWRATGQPGQGLIPTAPALCTKALAGAIGYNNQVSPKSTFLGHLSLLNLNNNAMSALLRDRIAHMAGLAFNVTTPQTTNLPIDLATLAPPPERLGAADYSDVEWFLDVYADGGTTASNLTVPVTYHDGTVGNLNPIAVGTMRAGRQISLTPFIPPAAQGKYIRAVNVNPTLSASTGTAGNFGFTVRRHKGAFPMRTLGVAEPNDWAQCRLAEFPNDACGELLVVCSTTSTGATRAEGVLVHLTP